MEFIEASAFTRHVYEYLTEEEYAGLQRFLFAYPEAGKIVPGSGGSERFAGECWEKAKAGVFESSITTNEETAKSGC